jgi:hypothetical protein
MTDTPSAEADGFEAEFEDAFEAEREETQATEEGGEGEEPEGKPAAKPKVDAEAKYKQTRTALQAERKARRDLEARLAALEEKTPANKPNAETVDITKIDVTEDPIAALKALQQLAHQLQEGERLTTEQQKAQNKANKELQDLQSWAGEQEEEFREDFPDYDDASKHFAETRAQELKDEGLTAQEVRNQLGQELAQITRRAQTTGKNPAEIVYKLAKNRGFGKSEVGKTLDKVRAGQEQSSRLSSPGGSVDTGPLTYAKVANLKGAAFDKAFEQLRAGERRR